MTPVAKPHRIVVIGAGFAGLETVFALERSGAEITLIDKRNHHLFQPLLYQVATASLATSEVAWPVRHLLRHRRDVTTLLAEVVGIDIAGKTVALADGAPMPYDTLVVATGAGHAYFGHDDWAAFAPGLKTLEDATAIRRKLLMAFEAAEREADAHKRAQLLTFVIIGAGPTGVELAGAIVELARVTLRDEFRRIDTTKARVVLVEATDRVLPTFSQEVSDYAHKALKRLGVDVMLGAPVTGIKEGEIAFQERTLSAQTLIWAAGVAASPAARWLDAEADRAGRVIVTAEMTLPGHPEIFVLGDTALIRDQNGKVIPGVGHAAKQEGRHVGRAIKARLAGDQFAKPLNYKHAGDLATIGKRAAVIDLGWITLKGWLGWWAWGLAHIYFLIGVKNRLFVAMSWFWTILTGQRGARLITQGNAEHPKKQKPGA